MFRVPNSMTEDYQEINLLDYIKVIVKRWKIITVIPIIVILITAFYTISLTPKIYEANSLMQIGQVNSSIIEPTAQTIPRVILTENTAKKILEQIQTEEQKEKLPIAKTEIRGLLKSIKINNGELKKEGTTLPENFLRLSYQDISPERAQQIVETLQDLILKEQQKEYDRKIKIRDENLAQKEKELAEIKKYLQDSDKQIDDLSALRYPANYADAQGRSFTARIQNRDNLRSQLSTLEEVILNAKLAQEYDKMSEIIDPPLLPNAPVKYQKLSITLAIALILGIFIGILFAFCQEWWENNKTKLKV